ncbi:MAG: hypothetical protein AAF720_13630 [Pseudomonadota bacterium]
MHDHTISIEQHVLETAGASRTAVIYGISIHGFENYLVRHGKKNVVDENIVRSYVRFVTRETLRE